MEMFNLVKTNRRKMFLSSPIKVNGYICNKEYVYGYKLGFQFQYRPFSMTVGDCELKRWSFMCDPSAQKGTSITYVDSTAISHPSRDTFT